MKKELNCYWGIFNSGKPVIIFTRFTIPENLLWFIDRFVGYMAKSLENTLREGDYVVFDYEGRE